jgi:MotA/TolQ/ExbB proton channel family
MAPSDVLEEVAEHVEADGRLGGPAFLPAATMTRTVLSRPLFLRWVVLQSVVATLLAAVAVGYGGRLHGASLVMVPVILLVLASTSGYAGLLAWRVDAGESATEGLRHLWFAAGVCQLLGLLGTVAGFYAMFNDGGESTSATAGTDLAARVTHGASVALSATFVGILASLVILLEHHVLDQRD